MKIAVVGTGGVGGYYGGLLAKAGHQVSFIARGAHLEAMRKNGLQIKSVFGDFNVNPVTASDNPAELDPVELALFTTKTYQTEAAAIAILPLITSETVVVPLQNGVDAVERIGEIVGMQHMVGGVTWLSAAIEEPGIIGQYSQFRRIAIGELDGSKSERVEKVCRALVDTGASVELVDNIREVLWTKFVFISAISALGGLTRVAIGEYRNVPETRQILVEALREVAAVARAMAIQLDPNIVEKTLSFIDETAPQIRPSMQRDLEAERVCELESMIGVVVRLGAKHGVSTPVMNLAYGVMKPALLKAQKI